jgi:hypothetical protein
MESALADALARHVDILREQGYATELPVLYLRAEDGTVLEIFEWRSSATVEAAHDDKRVQAIWQTLEEAAEFVPLSKLPNAEDPFPHFERFDPAPR